jgi:hypothetical protein
MCSAHRQSLQAKPGNQDYSRSFSSYEQHRSALLGLGYFVKQQFYLKNISAQSRRFDHLLNLLPARFPTEIAKIEGHGYVYGEPTFLVLWLDPGAVKRIEGFIQEQDGVN